MCQNVHFYQRILLIVPICYQKHLYPGMAVGFADGKLLFYARKIELLRKKVPKSTKRARRFFREQDFVDLESSEPASRKDRKSKLVNIVLSILVYFLIKFRAFSLFAR